MGMVSSGVEGAMLISYETYGPVFVPVDYQHLVIKSESAKVYHTGDKSVIFTDIERLGEEVGSENQFIPCAEIQLVTDGEFVRIHDAGCRSKLIGLGKNTTVDYHLYADNLHDYAKTMSDNLVFMAGDKSRVNVDNFSFKDSIAISLGEGSELYLAESSYPENDYSNNIAFSAGDHSSTTIGSSSTVFNSGDENYIYAIDQTDVVAVTTGKNTNIELGVDSLILSSENLRAFSLGKDSCAAIVWHDGTRKRVKVVYESEDGIVANKLYKLDANGNVIAA
jgi:hypothetical protein